MTKKEIVKTISEEIGMTQLVTKEIVQKTFDAIIETLVAEGRIELRNFGVFEVKKRKSRKARNPKTGDPVEAYIIVTTKPNELVAKVHDRMPVMLERDEALQWLDDPATPLRTYPAQDMEAVPMGLPKGSGKGKPADDAGLFGV